ncbi:MAG: hypothetical protein GY847_10175 [Proteobacteria bacterium]|nr:hypothetical protein [Pseudomonadota bacterium]
MKLRISYAPMVILFTVACVDTYHQTENKVVDDKACSFEVTSLTSEPGARSFGLVATRQGIPGISEQPTARGRMIGTLYPFGRRIYFGFGDYDNNTGPIPILSYGIVDETFHIDYYTTGEELLNFDRHDGDLFVTDIDPQGHATAGSVFRLDGDSCTWETMTPIEDAAHTYGTVSHLDKLYVTTGSVGKNAARVVASADSGKTWLTEHTTSDQNAKYIRYTHIGATREELFTSGKIYAADFITNVSVRAASDSQFAYLLRDEQWQAIGNLPDTGFLVPMTMRKSMAILAFDGDVGKGGVHTQSFVIEGDQLHTAQPLHPEQKFVNWSNFESNNSERTLALVTDNEGSYTVSISENLKDWETLILLPKLQQDDYTSIAFLDNNIYLGTANGDFYRVDEIWKPN